VLVGHQVPAPHCASLLHNALFATQPTSPRHAPSAPQVRVLPTVTVNPLLHVYVATEPNVVPVLDTAVFVTAGAAPHDAGVHTCAPAEPTHDEP
jgi:hypothetical protein